MRGHRWLVAWAALVALLSGQALALSRQVARYLRAATTLYENLEYEKALKQIERARGQSTGAEDDAAIALYEGIVFSDLGNEEKATTAFQTGLSLEPEAKLPLEVSPKVKAIFEKARANVQRLAPKIEETTSPIQVSPPLPPPPLVVETAPPPVREPVTETKQTAPSGSPRSYAWIPAAGGVLAAGGGAYFLFQAKADYDRLTDASQPLADPEADRLTNEGKRKQTLGLGLVAAGTVSLVAAGAMLTMGGEQTSAAVLAVPGQAQLVFIGRLP